MHTKYVEYLKKMEIDNKNVIKCDEKRKRLKMLTNYLKKRKKQNNKIKVLKMNTLRTNVGGRYLLIFETFIFILYFGLFYLTNFILRKYVKQNRIIFLY